jgi:hypothetical protein
MDGLGLGTGELVTGVGEGVSFGVGTTLVGLGLTVGRAELIATTGGAFILQTFII